MSLDNADFEEAEPPEALDITRVTTLKHRRCICAAGALFGALTLIVLLHILRYLLRAHYFSVPPYEMLQLSTPSAMLVARCNGSLVDYHSFLTAWFTASMPLSEYDTFITGMSLSPTVLLTDPEGSVHDAADLVAMLNESYGSEPQGSHHRPDLASIQLHHADATEVNLTFHEIITRMNEDSSHSQCTVQTQALCEAAPQKASGVQWRSFVERMLHCQTSERRNK